MEGKHEKSFVERPRVFNKKGTLLLASIAACRWILIAVIVV
jgi:hypothetical protein